MNWDMMAAHGLALTKENCLASHLKHREIADYKDLLSKGLVAPTQMEVFIADADGSDKNK